MGAKYYQKPSFCSFFHQQEPYCSLTFPCVSRKKTAQLRWHLPASSKHQDLSPSTAFILASSLIRLHSATASSQSPLLPDWRQLTGKQPGKQNTGRVQVGRENWNYLMVYLCHRMECSVEIPQIALNKLDTRSSLAIEHGASWSLSQAFRTSRMGSHIST